MAQEIPQQIVMGGAGGLQSYAPHNDLFVKQTRKGCIQEILGCEAKTEFKIATKAQQQTDIMYALEESNFFVRLFCAPIRPWTINVTGGPGTPGGPPVSLHERPCALGPGSCKCCCYQEVQHKDPTGVPLGSTKEMFWWFVPKFNVMRPDGSSEYLVSMPTCLGGLCINIFAEGLCNCRIPIYIFPPDATAFTQETKIGFITKIWSGLGTELFTDADKFEVEFPPGAAPDSKARILGTVFLMNQLFFEKNQ
mmetsp:Transcript_44020/g.110258  ORF Transcript_44020/g.110258 Transcript_44020/m.110258 type:complete len:251 (-) Transcript_44020:503-1255(-)|eukprot:CAMPEP_0173436204 /NCGR_PEP_ID=MMETSP1357-20121228/15816_1 /TAXON_ID=77926 /ORGANISM="Hemiselmis rufescens, Strain PCC563" /LENGTH=250 /DNA_ID=CAMNT_0014401265 /DNA_START=23 /DNA_END=775 /DNA_ORIENTATION=+